MIDLHSHILYGIDDGAKDEGMTLNMLRQAEEDGISTIVATPHFVVGANNYTRESLLARFNDVTCLIDEKNINVKLFLGNELFLDEYIFDAVENKESYTLAGTSYLLLELPMSGKSLWTEKVLYQFIERGYKPILAHPERYIEVLKNPGLLVPLIEMGCLMQINSSSINGVHGSEIKKMAKFMLENGMAHIVSSDGHSDKRRNAKLSAAYETVLKIVGREKADNLFSINPNKILCDEMIEISVPKHIKYKKGFVERIKDYFTEIKK